MGTTHPDCYPIYSAQAPFVGMKFEERRLFI